MPTVTFDTLEYCRTLEKAGVPKEQAEAFAVAHKRAVNEIIGGGNLATKADLADAKHEILKWMVMAMLAQTAILVGVIAFFK